MTFRKIASVYSILVGISMFATWIMFFAMGDVPGLDSEPVRTWFHIVAENMVGIALLAGGAGMWKEKRWGFMLYLVGMGMLLYAIVNSPGFYIERGDTYMIYVFSGSFIVAVIMAVLTFVKRVQFWGD
ncbi:MAG TPA: hypothetical protein PLN69_03600 [bacterium]|nr:hypothetical protein [bacterium]